MMLFWIGCAVLVVAVLLVLGVVLLRPRADEVDRSIGPGQPALLEKSLLNQAHDDAAVGRGAPERPRYTPQDSREPCW